MFWYSLKGFADGKYDKRLQRFETWLDPFSDPTDSGFQTVQSLYAIGSGGITGVGLGKSKQNASISNFVIQILEACRKPASDALAASKRFSPAVPIANPAARAAAETLPSTNPPTKAPKIVSLSDIDTTFATPFNTPETTTPINARANALKNACHSDQYYLPE